MWKLLATVTLTIGIMSVLQRSGFAQGDGDLVLTDNGKASAQIVISSAPSTTERYAANELQRTIEKISGAKLAISARDDVATARIVIGTPQSVPGIKAANLFNTPNAEEVRIARRGDTLYLAGKTPSTALYAVYTFLQDQLGARWYWPGESGEYLPQRATIAIGALDVRQTPDIRVRSLSINSPHYDLDTLTWMARNRMNLHNLQGPASQIASMHERGFQVMIGGHNAYLDKEVVEQHPEFIAEVNGKRQIIVDPPHLCWSNVGAQKALAAKMAQWWNENPDVDSVSIYGADHNYFCECAQCKAYAPDVSTRWHKFSSAVIAEVNKTHPGKHYQTLAYQSYRDVPTQVAPFDLIGYTTYNINYTKPLSDPTNATATGEIKAWQKLGAKMGLRGYQFIPFNQAMYVPLTGLIVDEVAWTKQNGLQGWTSEVTPFGHPSTGSDGKKTLPQDENWVTNRMALYAAAQAMWDSALQPADLMRDWTEHIYGPAAAPMLAYHTAMEAAWRGSKKTLSYFLQPPASFAGSFLSDALLKTADANFKAARQALSQEKDGARQGRIAIQIQLEEQMLDKWRQTYLLQQGRAGRMQAYAPRVIVNPQLTGDAADPAWNGLASLPVFETTSGTATETTSVLAQWDKHALYLRFVAHDNNIAQLKTLHGGHDEDIFGDDEIELFLDDPSRPGHYFHLAVNAKGARYDARADGAMNFEPAWNPQWTAKTSVETDSWIADIALPFASFGIAANEGTSWRMSFLRGSADRRPHSGWPDAAVHNPAGFGTLTLVEKAPAQKRVLLYDAGGNSESLRTELARLGFTASHSAKDEAEFAAALSQGADAILLRLAGGDFALSEKFMTETMQPFLQRGGLLVLSSYGQWPLEKWFGADAAVKWAGWEIDAKRHTTSFDGGDWSSTPHKLRDIIENGITPSSGFVPQSDKWEVLARQKMADGEEAAYLMRVKIGRGTLVLTSTDYGYGGGHEMFGSMNPANAAMLLDNLLAMHRTSVADTAP